MSLLRKISTTLKKYGYQKEYDRYDMKIFLKWVETRYAFGFAISKLPKRKYPEIGVGILDKKLGLIQNEVEGTQDLGFYHLSDVKNLFNNGLLEQEHTPQVIDDAIKIIEKQIGELEEKQQIIIDDFRFYLNQLSIFPYFHDHVPNLKYYAHFYYGLLFRLVEQGNLTTNDMAEAIKLAEEKKVYNKDLQFKLNLIKEHLKK